MRLKRIGKLIKRAGAGDRAAFERLYDKTAPVLFGICLRILSNRDAAEEALKDTYQKIWIAAPKYKDDGLSPMTWLITLARNTAIDRLRKQKGRLADLETVQEQMVSGAPDPRQLLAAAAEGKKLLQCLNTLDKDRAAAIRAVYLDGASYADLALRFDVPLNTVRDWLKTGLLTLRDCVRS